MSKEEMIPAEDEITAAYDRIEELERLNTFASYDAKVAELKAELYAISVALNDPRTDLTMTMVEVITDQHKERDQLREQVKMLRDALERIGKYPRVRGDELGYAGCRTVAAEALAATEVMP